MTKILPLLALRGDLIFPHVVTPLIVDRDFSIRAAEEAIARDDRYIFLVAQKDASNEEPAPDEIYTVGTIARIKQHAKTQENELRILVEGVQRASIVEYIRETPFFAVEVTPLEDDTHVTPEVEALMRAARDEFASYVELNESIPNEILSTIESIDDPGRLSDIIAAQMNMELKKKQELLEDVSSASRLEKLCIILREERQILTLEKKIHLRVRKRIEKSQKEYYLREQMKAIREELGETEGQDDEIERLREQINAAGMPGPVREKALHELGRLAKMPPVAAESVVVRNYLDWLIALPWNKRTEDRLDIEIAEQILERDHYGLSEVKERIIEFLAVRQIARDLKGPILCLVGPPGVGKTSLGQSIAKALERRFVRFSLGGVRDEAEIRGHRRTYVGALPGKIIQALRRAGTKNPVMLLDEVDKMSSDFRGDPTSALLEVLDPEQNSNFEDHYIEVPFDLSEVLFLTTANVRHNIPGPLLDRMEVIEIPGYTDNEKLQIGKRYLLPKQLKAHGLSEDQVLVSDNAIRTIINEYTREAGVRNLERNLAKICRKAARRLLKDEERCRVRVAVSSLPAYLGPPRFRHGRKQERPQVGVASGLAYTEYGGDVLAIEVTVVKGKGKLILTGKLGEVMRESAQASYSYVRSRAAEFGIAENFHEEFDLHVHVPEGAIPKDGPSAGITMAIAMISALTNRPVRNDVAMTGEITLRGRVLAIGGLKEKILAAHRAGIKTIIIPKENEKSLSEIPADVKQDLHIYPVEHMDEVVALALLDARKKEKAAEWLPAFMHNSNDAIGEGRPWASGV